MVHDHDAVAQPLRLFHVVRRVHERLAPRPQGLEVVEDRVAALRVDAHRRLVEQDELRVVQQARGQVQAPLHPAAERLDPVARAFGEADEGEAGGDGRLQGRSGQAVEGPEEPQVLARGQLVEEREVLGHEADGGFGRVGVAAQGLAVDADLTRIGGHDPRDHPHRRAFARAVGAEESDQLAGADRERDVGDGGERPEGLAQVPRVENRRHVSSDRISIGGG